MREAECVAAEMPNLDGLPESLREIIKAYDRSPDGTLTNDSLYREVARKAGKPLDEFMQR